jgi:hypothetical protein
MTSSDSQSFKMFKTTDVLKAPPQPIKDTYRYSPLHCTEILYSMAVAKIKKHIGVHRIADRKCTFKIYYELTLYTYVKVLRI